MKMLALPVVLIAVVAAGCTPSIRPELRKEVDETIANHPNKTTTYENRGTRIPQWKVGQWVLIKQVDQDGKVSITRIGIVKQEGSAFWIENSTTSYYGKNDAAILIDGFDGRDLSKVRILKMKTRDEDGKVTELTEDQINFASPASFVDIIKQSQVEGAKETVTVPAGVFKDAVKTHVTVQTQAVVSASSEGDVWTHSAVPIYGYAKSVMTGKALWMTMTTHDEILDFGNEGAKSVFP